MNKKRESNVSARPRTPRPTVREYAALLEEVRRLRLANDRLREEKYIAHLALLGSHIHTNDWQS